MRMMMTERRSVAATLLVLLACTVSCSQGLVRSIRMGGVPPPSWQPSYLMNQSTAIMICNETGLLSPELTSQFGLVDVDWSNGKDIWAAQKPMDCEDLLITQAKMIKQASPRTKVMVYRNLVKALPWYPSIAEKLSDPAYSGWFLHFDPNVKPHVPTDNTTFYHDHEQTPDGPMCNGTCDCGGIPCGEYLWDHRNSSLREWIINSHIKGSTGLGSGIIDGFYIDDAWVSSGPTEEDSHSVEDCGLSAQDVKDMISNWTVTQQQAYDAIIAAGAYSWQFLNCEANQFCGGNTQNANGWNQTDPRPHCATWLRENCANTSTIRNITLFFGFTRVTHSQPFPLPAFHQDLASFLLVRGPYAYIGYGWEGCVSGTNDPFLPVPPELHADYGEPTETCHETAENSGVFVRDYTKATVTMDCNSWTGTVTPK